MLRFCVVALHSYKNSKYLITNNVLIFRLLTLNELYFKNFQCKLFKTFFKQIQ